MRKLLLLCSIVLAAFTASAQCIASFTTTAAPVGNSLLNIHFNNVSSYGSAFVGQIKKISINYGDGNNYSGVYTIPDHAYTTPGIYTVGLRIYSVDSATSTIICTDSIGILVVVAYQPCGSRISIFGTGASRTFIANTPGGTPNMTYSWNYGDGSTLGTGTTVSHTYASAGIYAVTLIASAGAPAFCSYTNTQYIYISIPPPALTCANLHAGFNSSVSGNIVTFTNTSTNVSSPYLMIVSWDFGDGGTASGFTIPPHTYTAPGAYPVKLKIQWRDSLLLTSCRDSIVHTVNVLSVPTPPNIISGTVIYDSLASTHFFKVWLIKYDSATNLLYAVDSQITANTAFPYYSFGGKPAGLYRTKAAEHLGSTGGTGLMPTYHDSSVYWNLAKVITHTGSSTLNKNIYMRTGTVSSGPGFIGGNVSLGANKGATNGVSGILIFLRNATTKVIERTLTDAAGDYAFSNIPLGAYSIYPEELNYITLPVTPIVLNNANPEKRAVDFNMDIVKHSIAPRSTTGIVIGCNCTADAVTVFPNPASNIVKIQWRGQEDETNQFTVTSITGKVVARSQPIHSREGSLELNIGGLAPGVYFIHGTGMLAGNISKLIIQ